MKKWLPGTAAEALVDYALKIGAMELFLNEEIFRKLKSGRMSPYFFNSGKFCTGTSIGLLGDSFAESIKKTGIDYDVVFGPAYKGISLAVATAMSLSRLGLPDAFAHDRKEEKLHGEGGIMVGSSMEGKKVALIDDVTTDGKTKEVAMQRIKDSGGEVVACFIAFDRQERGQNAISALEEFYINYKVPMYAAAELTDLFFVLDATANQYMDRAMAIPLIRQYNDTYGVFPRA
ncbi:MAG: orotate phosphoribosyltransferase [Candidatus Gracilibacteria bacterium]|nr:orotate phosphoribosyltransferase [Candidatus Gracilibacteria bacterium]